MGIYLEMTNFLLLLRPRESVGTVIFSLLLDDGMRTQSC